MRRRVQKVVAKRIKRVNAGGEGITYNKRGQKLREKPERGQSVDKKA